jgi:hypothetical protein
MMPDGETFDHACKTAADWLSGVASPTVAISHGLTGRLLGRVYLGLSRRQLLELPVPHKEFFRRSDGCSHLIE